MTVINRELLSFGLATVVLTLLVFAFSAPVWISALTAGLIYFGVRLITPLADESFEKNRQAHIDECADKLTLFSTSATALPEGATKHAAQTLVHTLLHCLNLKCSDSTHPKPLPELPDRLDHLNRLLKKHIRVEKVKPDSEVISHTTDILHKTELLYRKRIDSTLDIEAKETDLKSEALLNEEFLRVEQELEEFE